VQTLTVTGVGKVRLLPADLLNSRHSTNLSPSGMNACPFVIHGFIPNKLMMMMIHAVTDNSFFPYNFGLS